MKTIVTIFGVVCGAIGGLALGVLAAMCVLAWVKSLNLNHPGEDVARMLVIVTAPVGVMFGAVLGGLTIASRPRLFMTTFLPLTILVVVIVYFVGSLRGMDRPRQAEFVGVVSVDGDVQKGKGELHVIAISPKSRGHAD